VLLVRDSGGCFRRDKVSGGSVLLGEAVSGGCMLLKEAESLADVCC
jgi:hypothetical protein